MTAVPALMLTGLLLLTAPGALAQGEVGVPAPLFGPIPGQAGELVDLGNGVPALRLFAGEAGVSQSMLLADAGLLGLARPELFSAFDELVYDAGEQRPLLVIVTSTGGAPWQAEIRFSQGSSETRVNPASRLQLLAGDPQWVGPEEPVLAVALLPAEFSLRRPILISWSGSSAVVTFRR